MVLSCIIPWYGIVMYHTLVWYCHVSYLGIVLSCIIPWYGIVMYHTLAWYCHVSYLGMVLSCIIPWYGIVMYHTLVWYCHVSYLGMVLSCIIPWYGIVMYHTLAWSSIACSFSILRLSISVRSWSRSASTLLYSPIAQSRRSRSFFTSKSIVRNRSDRLVNWA